MNRFQLIQTSLQSPDEEVRLCAVQSLYHYDGEERLELICRALGDPAWRIRKEAVNLFLSLPKSLGSAEHIVALLYDEENAGLRNAAAEVLIRLHSFALPVLIASAETPDHDVRKFILDILGDIGDRHATPLLLRLLQTDAETNVRAAAAENLGKLQDVTAVPVMLDALAEPDLLVQFSILDALTKIGVAVPVGRIVEMSKNRLLRKPLFDALGRIGDETSVVLLVDGLLDSMRNVRESALLALQSLVFRYGEGVLDDKMTPAALESVGALLTSPTLAVQRAALGLLGIHCNKVGALLLASYLDNERLADDVASILVTKGSEIVSSLVDCWEGASEKKKAYLAYLFAENGAKNAVNLLVNELKSADDFLRTVLLRALGQVGEEEEIAIIAGYLDVPEEDVRQAAADGLVKLAERLHSSVIDFVRGAFTHSDPRVRQSSLQVLGRLGGKSAEVTLLMAMKDESSLVRRTAIYYLDGRNPEHYPALTLALTDEESDVRRQAVEALSMSSDRSLIEPMTLVLMDGDPWVRATAVRALGRFGGTEALAAIHHSLHDSVGLVTIAALETLREGMFPFDSKLIAEKLSDDDDDVVLEILKLLAQGSDFDWLGIWGERLLAHRHWQVRQTVAELLGQGGSNAGLTLLQQRLLVEEEDVVRAALCQSIASHSTVTEHN